MFAIFLMALGSIPKSNELVINVFLAVWLVISLYLGWVKVAAYYTDNSNELNWKYITCRNLTEAQTNVLFKQ